ncbi:c-type cytochrome biogenesis protein CcsB [Demequina sp. NBRC 110052]|uniref:c-type cytochrome biogenesis protein CcsB n=1 Tax=Demequina sp. NBRC 110052 TaxID=1570341 RepID=UPI0009FFFBAA|nr:c-type cytochrome biogenesis protein CcsB [Demequina sp. NBRC 110052]
MTPQSLSLVTLWAATSLYAIAMVAWAIRLSRIADERVQAREAVVAEPATVAAGMTIPAPASGMGAGPVVLTEDDLPRRSAADRALGTARTAMIIGLLLHAVGLVTRGIDSGHVPWSNMYEYTITGSFVAVAVFAIVQARRDVSYLGAGVTGFATIALGIALTTLYSVSTGLQPALQSFWLVIHVSIAIISTGIFIVAFIATVLQLWQHARDEGQREVTGGGITRLRHRVHNAVAGWAEGAKWMAAVPKAMKLEALAFRLNAVGFVLWTFTVMAGAVWAEHAWGRYWGWDPKEVWSFVIWVLYAAYLHARTTQGWRGPRSAWVSVWAFVALIMNFTVVNLFFQGLHTYAGS